MIKMALILSQPSPVFVSLANNIFNISSIIFLGYLLILYWLRNKLTNPNVLSTNFYQIPSHPITINSSYVAFIGIYFISGLHVIICYEYVKAVLRLYAKSPNALVRLSPPFTRPLTTVPPAFLIRLNYIGSCGLWSYENTTKVPLRHKALLESPEFAT